MSNTYPHITYIDPQRLAHLLKEENQIIGKDLAIVDVRDSDFIGGNITGAKNYPSRDFHGSKDHLLKEMKHVPMIIFHCALSQVRGPKCARIYHQLIQENPDSNQKFSQQILILKGGFTAWQSKFREDPTLVENFDKELWENVD